VSALVSGIASAFELIHHKRMDINTRKVPHCTNPWPFSHTLSKPQ
jgi:hypothetical protein